MNPADTDSLDLGEEPRGTRLRLRVRAGSRNDAVVGVHDGALKLSVTAAPEKGKANKAVLALLASTLAVPASSIALLAGHGSREKTVLVPLGAGELRARLVAGA